MLLSFDTEVLEEALVSFRHLAIKGSRKALLCLASVCPVSTIMQTGSESRTAEGQLPLLQRIFAGPHTECPPLMTLQPLEVLNRESRFAG